MSDAGSAPSFEHDIKPLFRPTDQQSMDFMFDLWNYQDVRENAAEILERVQDGTMPCDGDWPPEQVDLFRRWVDGGMAP
jgi:hypothetical protein